MCQKCLRYFYLNSANPLVLFFSLVLFSHSRLRMYFFLGTMHIGSLYKMRRDSRSRGLHHLFRLIRPHLKSHLMCLTNGSTQLHRVWYILSDKRWMPIDFTRLAPFLNILFLPHRKSIPSISLKSMHRSRYSVSQVKVFCFSQEQVIKWIACVGQCILFHQEAV